MYLVYLLCLFPQFMPRIGTTLRQYQLFSKHFFASFTHQLIDNYFKLNGSKAHVFLLEEPLPQI